MHHFLPVDRAYQLKAVLEQVFHTGVMENYESPVLSLAGELHNVLWSTYVIHNSKSEPIGMLNAGVDLGKKKPGKMQYTIQAAWIS